MELANKATAVRRVIVSISLLFSMTEVGRSIGAMIARMRHWLFVLALATACGSKSETPTGSGSGSGSADKPHHKNDRREPQEGADQLALTITVAGAPDTLAWGPAEFAKIKQLDGTASDGEARDTWSLAELVHANLGPTARVTVVTGEGKATIDAAAWADPKRVPILHTTRRGTLKFRWSDPAGKWGETVVKDVTALEVVK